MPPALTDAAPSLLLIDRSACGVSVSLSLAELLPVAGSEVLLEIEAVLISVPVADAAIEQVAE